MFVMNLGPVECLMGSVSENLLEPPLVSGDITQVRVREHNAKKIVYNVASSQ